jgi:hypothetical protein
MLLSVFERVAYQHPERAVSVVELGALDTSAQDV